MKRRILSERNWVVILFVMVFVIFSLAQEDTKKIEKMYQDSSSATASSVDKAQIPETKAKARTGKDVIPAVHLR